MKGHYQRNRDDYYEPGTPGQFKCEACGSVCVISPKVGCDLDDVEYCPICGSDSVKVEA